MASSRNFSNTDTLRTNSETIPWLHKSQEQDENGDKRFLSVIQERTDQSESRQEASTTLMQKRTYIESQNDMADIQGSLMAKSIFIQATGNGENDYMTQQFNQSASSMPLKSTIHDGIEEMDMDGFIYVDA